MKFVDIARELRELGRDVNPRTLEATRKLIAPLHNIIEPPLDVDVVREIQYFDVEDMVRSRQQPDLSAIA